MSLLLPLTLAMVAASPTIEGHWEGTARCPPPASSPGGPPQAFALNVLIAQGPKGPQGFINSPREGLSSELRTIALNEGQLRVTASVPQNYQAILTGAVEGSTWTATLTQGPLSCSATLQRVSDLQLTMLPIPPAYQAQPMWCWVTIGEMIFRHYGVLGPGDTPGFQSQCTIVRALFTGSPRFECITHCSLCESMGGGSAHEVAGMLADFPRRLAATGRQVPRLFIAATPVLAASELMRELDQGNPVGIGIHPGASFTLGKALNSHLPPLHVALVVGYLKSASTTWYLVNDPYPFPDPLTSPYVQHQATPLIGLHQGAPVPVAYWIRESALKSGLKWTESFLVRSEPASAPVTETPPLPPPPPPARTGLGDAPPPSAAPRSG